MKKIIVDVRERDEFEAESIDGAINIPLSHFDSAAPGTLSHFLQDKIILMCRSGARAALAKDQAMRLGFQPTGGYEVFEGGILAWKKQGRPTVQTKSNHLPILRQVHLIAGSLIVLGVLLGYFVHPGYFALSGFVGLGLTFAGASGICMMSNLLAYAPWNKNSAHLKSEVCVAGSGKPNCDV